MTRRVRATLLVLALGSPVVAAAACGGGDPVKTAPSGAPKQPPLPSSAQAAQAQKKLDGGVDGSTVPQNLPPLPVARELQESDFSETDRNRDPFRPFQRLFVSEQKGRVVLQRTVLVDRYALDELKLAGIVTRGPAKASVIDPIGIGWVAKVGDFVGKAELVHSGGPGGEDVPLNWRVDRIRDTDVVFIREDPSHADIPATSRVVSLYPVEEGSPGAPNR